MASLFALRRTTMLAPRALRAVGTTPTLAVAASQRFASRYQQLINKTRPGVKEVTPAEVTKIQDNVLIVDVREPEELTDVIDVKNLVCIPRGVLEGKIDANVDDSSTPIVLYCAGGMRSLLSADTLQDMGYTNVMSMEGGIGRWRDENLPLRKGPQEK